MKPDRPALAILLFIVIWLLAGGITASIYSGFSGRVSPMELEWYRDSALIAAAIVLFGIAFMTGRGWSRVVIGLLFILDGAYPWLRNLGGLETKDFTLFSCCILPGLGLAVSILMYVLPPIREWMRECKQFRAPKPILPD